MLAKSPAHDTSRDSNCEPMISTRREEDWVLGGIIVQDCLDLLSHLLQSNVGNQLMFR